MRNASQLGNIYFDDLFANGMPILSSLFWYLNGTIGCVNLIMAPIFFYYACLSKSYNRNLKLVSSNIYLSFLFSAFGNGVYSILVLSHLSDYIYDYVFFILRNIHTAGPNLLKTTFLAIIFERAAATKNYKTYEKRPSLILGLSLYLFGQLGALMPLSFFIFRVNVYISVVIGLFFNLICWTFIFLIIKINETMRRKQIDVNMHLSHRFQIAENLRFLRIMKPIIITGGIIETTAILTSTLEAAIDYNTQLYYPIYMLATNSYVLIFYLLYLKRDEYVRNKLLSFLRVKSAMIAPMEIRNVIGESLVVKNEAEIHFLQLNKCWS